MRPRPLRPAWLVSRDTQHACDCAPLPLPVPALTAPPVMASAAAAELPASYERAVHWMYPVSAAFRAPMPLSHRVRKRPSASSAMFCARVSWLSLSSPPCHQSTHSHTSVEPIAPWNVVLSMWTLGCGISPPGSARCAAVYGSRRHHVKSRAHLDAATQRLSSLPGAPFLAHSSITSGAVLARG